MSMLRVAVFNDSPAMRAAIRAAVEREPDMRVVTEQASADDAAAVVARSHADAVIMDVVIAALLRTMAGAQLARMEPAETGRPSGEPLPTAGTRAWPSAPCPIGAIGIVASAGGPSALGVLLRALPAGVMPPILLVQHLAAGFTASFASWLDSSTGHPVLIAEHGQRAIPGCVYMPPEDHHIGLAPDLRIYLDGLDSAPPIAGFRPSGDHLLTALARHGRRALGVVLSGMGRDGAEGAARLRQAGGHVVAQALESATVIGMPSAASQSGAAEAMLAPEGIASWLTSRIGVA